jgi:hypothetical protein
MASENELRAKYRATKLEASLDCGPAKAAEMAKRVAYLSDDDFDRYAGHSAETLSQLKARAGVTGAAPAKEPPASEDAAVRTRAAVAEFVASEFFGLQEGEARHGRRRT